MKLDKFADSDELYARIDGKIISRKSLYEARVYSESYNDKEPFIYYKSRIQHCGSCIEDDDYSYRIDRCCCIHSQFKNKKEENDYVKSIGFWKINQ